MPLTLTCSDYCPPILKKIQPLFFFCFFLQFFFQYLTKKKYTIFFSSKVFKFTGAYCLRGHLSGGLIYRWLIFERLLYRGLIVGGFYPGDFYPGGFYPDDFCPGAFYRGAFCRGAYELDSDTHSHARKYLK